MKSLLGHKRGLMGKQQAFTLVELAITIAILAILAMIAYPSMMEALRKMESKKVESIIHSALIEARNESHITKRNIIICPADDSNNCNKQSDVKIIVFRDVNNDAQFHDNALVKEYSLNLKHGRVDMRVSASRNYIKYFGSSASPRGHFGHIKYCSVSDNETLSYKMILTHTGLVRKSFDDVSC